MTDFAFIKRCMLCGENNIKQSISCSGCNNILDREIELEEIPIEYVECVCGEKTNAGIAGE